ncbi:unnamed protein product [Malus baccata var. baccata]
MADNRTLRELAMPNTDQQPLCITYPNVEGGFELKSGMIHYLPQFHGFSTEDANKHLMEFHVVRSGMRPSNVDEEQVKLRAFPFTLEAKANEWLYNLPPGSMNTWNQGQERQKYDPYSNNDNAGWCDHPYLKWNYQDNGQHLFPTTITVHLASFKQDRRHYFNLNNNKLQDLIASLANSTQSYQQKIDKAVEYLERQMSQLASLMGQQYQPGRLPSQIVVNPNAEQMNVVTLKSGKEVFEQPRMQKRTRKDTNEQGKLQTKNLEQDEASTETKKSHKATKLNKKDSDKSKKEQTDKEILDTFRKVQVNLPFLDDIKQVPKYAKFLKGLCTNKRRFNDQEIMALSEEDLSSKEKKNSTSGILSNKFVKTACADQLTLEAKVMAVLTLKGYQEAKQFVTAMKTINPINLAAKTNAAKNKSANTYSNIKGNGIKDDD